MFQSLEFPKEALIGKGWRSLPRRFPVVSPATGEAVVEVADCGSEEAAEALEEAVAAQRAWSQATAYERAGVLRRWHDLILAHEEPLARLMALEMGKPLKEARGEVRYAAGFVEWYAEEAKRVYGETLPSQFPHKRILVRYEPVGPVYGITPWNFPAAMVTRKVAPALAAGNSFVLKPAEESPLTALYLARLFLEAGGPPGVFQVLPTSDPEALSRPFLEDERVRKLTFTGSTPVGLKLYGEAAKTLKRVSLELGGGAPVLVFADADLERAVAETVRAKFRNVGQSCVAANLILVEEPVAEAFAEAYAERVKALKVGDPLLEETDIGPLVNRAALEKVEGHVQDALARGASLVAGGEAKGLYFAPTVLLDVRPGSRIFREETFGPVAPIATFQNEEEAVARANALPSGLAAYLFTRNLSRAFRVAEALDYGIVGVNDGVPSTPQAPFGGVRRSGLGREGGRWGLEEYLEVKYISLGL
ncbi:NAD-dependent succinate-semialdehyde dehydrogenase [Thermus thermamylovorans]|uniref:NAD-dependent succinate-semialdehyde dehydrogenase n=1 Tax=Thermus thermamylovorans TaxID=2509362 RepID=A0A4Q9B914_9DEIN|nr:NAD-dependent succinate-semialdehyde dehydrogenase [Thermus thermamylovorans]TBH21828.1 NAD-dependent succinate-semialdehyde dehydrogenase [Thermus thermamylovorans]